MECRRESASPQRLVLPWAALVRATQDEKELARQLGNKPKDPEWYAPTRKLRERRAELFQQLNGLLHKMEGRLYQPVSLMSLRSKCVSLHCVANAGVGGVCGAV